MQTFWKRLVIGALISSFAILIPVSALAASSAAPAAPAQPAATQALATQSFGQRIVATARTFLGKPYRFGATGPDAYDCSGFVRAVFRRNGVQLPRTAAQQSRVGTFVKKADLQIGDVVFFKDTYKPGVSHVGIYMGGGKFIHAWPGTGVTIGDLSRPYFVNHYWGAKRMR